MANIKFEDQNDVVGSEYNPIDVDPTIEPKVEDYHLIEQFCKTKTDGKYIIVWMTIPKAHTWRLPKEFNTLPNLKAKMKLTVYDQRGYRYTWGLINEAKKRKTKLCVSGGWAKYLKDHVLSIGDEVVFAYDIKAREFNQLHLRHEAAEFD